MAKYTLTITTKFENISEEDYTWWLQRQESGGMHRDVAKNIRERGEATYTTKNPCGEGTGSTTYKVERKGEP